MVFISCFVGGEIALNVTCHLAAQMEIQGSRQGKLCLVEPRRGEPVVH